MDNDNNLKNNLMVTIGTIIFMSIFALLGIHYMPLNLLVFPLVFIVHGVKNGIMKSLINIIIIAMIVSIAVDVFSGLLLVVTFAPVAVIIAYGIKNRRKPGEILIYSSVAFFIATILAFGYARNVSGISIVSQMEESFNQMLNAQIGMFEDMGLTNFEMLKTKDLLENAYKYILWILPTILIIFSLLISYVNYYASVVILRKLGVGIKNIPRFSRFRLPSNFIPGTIVMFLGVFLIRQLQMPHHDTILLNLFVLIGFLFLIQGLSVIDSFLIKVKVKLVFRTIFLFLSVFITPLVSIISLLGAVDIAFDFRKLKKQKS